MCDSGTCQWCLNQTKSTPVSVVYYCNKPCGDKAGKYACEDCKELIPVKAAETRGRVFYEFKHFKGGYRHLKHGWISIEDPQGNLVTMHLDQLAAIVKKGRVD